MTKSSFVPDPWAALRRNTAARVALGRAGGSLPTHEVLDFALAHAAARDAVHAPLDCEQLSTELRPVGLPVLLLATQAPDRQTYLQRPDLGRRLAEESLAALQGFVKRDRPLDISLVVGDGLSAPAAQWQAAAVLMQLVPKLREIGLAVAPVCVVRHARVAVQDQIGEVLGARLSVILLGERPGLGTSQSLSAYLVYGPRIGRTDAERNCISNIRAGGFTAEAAASTLLYLITASLGRQLSGIALKDDRPSSDHLMSTRAIPGSAGL
ncbi:MAG TPA: ethanolamine ammonia-lyase subunit EutC [Tepidisphaeraceae bacterium]|nr:ethanolamine ammonia-lyase subunit EutC [Tepidisphaeraceae bacterium]